MSIDKRNPKNEYENVHFEHESHLHKRNPTSDDHQDIISKSHNTTNVARLRSSISDDEIKTLHDPVEFSWKQFWETFIYENLPPVIFSPLAVILIERSFKKAWNVMNHRCLFVFSRKHNSVGNHLFFWLFFYPINWFLIISLFMGIFLNDSLIRNVDKFQIIIVFLFVSLRNLIVSVKYGYYRGEDYEQLSKDPPHWDEFKTNRRLVGQGWSNPSKYPSLIEDELVCAMDENDVTLQGISFKLDQKTSEVLRNHKTNKLFTAKTLFNKDNDVTAGFIIHQILSSIYNIKFPKGYGLWMLCSGIIIMSLTFIIRKYYGLNAFGVTGYEITIYICCLIGLFGATIGALNFGLICAHDFNRRYLSQKIFDDLIKYPGIKINDFLFFNQNKNYENIEDDNDNLSPSENKIIDNDRLFINFKDPQNVFAWMVTRKVLRSFGEVFYLRIQGYTSIILFFAITCVIILNLIAWMEIRHHISTIWLLIVAVIAISSVCIHAIFKASKLQSLSSIQREMIKKELIFLEKDLIDAENDNNTSIIRKINHAKFLIQQIDESINFNELVHKPTKVMGYPATQNVVSSSLGIIITGFVLAVEGFSGSDIVYDSMGWFKF